MQIHANAMPCPPPRPTRYRPPSQPAGGAAGMCLSATNRKCPARTRRMRHNNREESSHENTNALAASLSLRYVAATCERSAVRHAFF